MSDDNILRCKLRIKEWENNFKEKNGKVPSKEDAKASEIWSVYQMYNKLKARTRRKTHEPEEEDSKAKTETNRQASIQTEDHSTSNPSIVAQSPKNALKAEAEFGPTPQANGRVLLIFDMISGTPELSPLKPKNEDPKNLPFSSNPDTGFKTPTRPPRQITFAELTPSRSSASRPSVAEKLAMALSPTRTPSQAVAETPFYLRRAELPAQIGAKLESEPQTPSKTAVVTFQVSPSPLKPVRILSFGKKISDLANELREIDEEELAAQRLEYGFEETEDDGDCEQGEPTTENAGAQKRRRKAITQKRTTRRWKIKPRSDDGTTTSLEGKNVHDEVQRLQEKEQTHRANYLNGVANEESEEEDNLEQQQQAQKPARARKHNLVSNNFKRLKINDPRTRRFKRMRGRR